MSGFFYREREWLLDSSEPGAQNIQKAYIFKNLVCRSSDAIAYAQLEAYGSEASPGRNYSVLAVGYGLAVRIWGRSDRD